MKIAQNKILMIDDDVKLCRLVKDYLSPFGFELTAIHDGLSGIETVKKEEFNAIILDVMLPQMDGFTVLKEIRKFSDIPILMLTALGDESDRIVGLEIGADDYLPKTFSTRELLARLRAVTRRSQFRQSLFGTEISVKDISLNVETREVKKAEEPIILTALEFDLLNVLMKFAGRVLDRDKLLDEITGRSYDVFDRSIDVHIASLRRKIGDDAKKQNYIKTVRSVGYLFVKESE